MSILHNTSQNGLDLVFAERYKQVIKLGYTLAHDRKEHPNGELLAGAIEYLEYNRNPKTPRGWPFEEAAWHPGTRLENLVKAAAMIVAEIDMEIVKLKSLNMDP